MNLRNILALTATLTIAAITLIAAKILSNLQAAAITCWWNLGPEEEQMVNGVPTPWYPWRQYVCSGPYDIPILLLILVGVAILAFTPLYIVMLRRRS